MAECMLDQTGLADQGGGRVPQLCEELKSDWQVVLTCVGFDASKGAAAESADI